MFALWIIYGIGTSFFGVLSLILLTLNAPFWQALVLTFGWPIAVPYLFIKDRIELGRLKKSNRSMG